MAVRRRRGRGFSREDPRHDVPCCCQHAARDRSLRGGGARGGIGRRWRGRALPRSARDRRPRTRRPLSRLGSSGSGTPRLALPMPPLARRHARLGRHGTRPRAAAPERQRHLQPLPIVGARGRTSRHRSRTSAELRPPRQGSQQNAAAAPPRARSSIGNRGRRCLSPLRRQR